MGIGLLLLCISLLGVLGISKSAWSLVPFVSFIQYPWRLLSFSILALGICGSFAIALFHRPITRFVIAGIIIVACIAINGKLFRPQYQYFRDSKAFEAPEELQYRISKISDEYLPPGIMKPKTPNELVH